MGKASQAGSQLKARWHFYRWLLGKSVASTHWGSQPVRKMQAKPRPAEPAAGLAFPALCPLISEYRGCSGNGLCAYDRQGELELGKTMRESLAQGKASPEETSLVYCTQSVGQLGWHLPFSGKSCPGPLWA